MEEGEQRVVLHKLFSNTVEIDRFPMMKLLTGAMRVGVSQGLVVRAIARSSGLSPETVAHRLMGDWEPSAEAYRRLIDPDTADSDLSRPYPFALANPIEGDSTSLGAVESYLLEWKWDGIRSQLIRRGGTTYLWSRGEERLDGKYPEIEHAAAALECDCVLDGEILAWKDGFPLPFAELQRRIGRKSVGKKLLQEVPVRFVAFDLLELAGDDWRSRTQRERRDGLEKLLGCDTRTPLQLVGESSIAGNQGRVRSESNAQIDGVILPSGLVSCSSKKFDENKDDICLSQRVVASSWDDINRIREASRAMKAEGLMLKRLDATYPVGRTRGHWWKWKIAPYTIDAVLIYAQRGHGRRAALYTDFTFALWDNGVLVPFAKAYSGLTDQELIDVDRYVRAHTQEKFGPVRSVTPQLVMELAFENIRSSNRHKSGIAVRFPRIVRWRHDKKIEDADSLADLKRMIRLEDHQEH